MGGGAGPLSLRENHLGHLWIKARGLWLLPSWHQARGNAEWTVPAGGAAEPTDPPELWPPPALHQASQDLTFSC